MPKRDPPSPFRVARRAGADVPPRAARKPDMLDEWDVVRAAQHMREAHGAPAAAVADQRARNAADGDLARRWRAIAQAIRKLDGKAINSPSG